MKQKLLKERSIQAGVQIWKATVSAAPKEVPHDPWGQEKESSRSTAYVPVRLSCLLPEVVTGCLFIEGRSQGLQLLVVLALQRPYLLLSSEPACKISVSKIMQARSV